MNASNAKDYLPLVQALVEGKTVQYRLLGEKWSTGGDVDFSLPPDQYRIKPEPREIWVNRFPDGHEGLTWYETEEAANRAYVGAVQVRYREVIE